MNTEVAALSPPKLRYKNLGEFLSLLKAKGELREIHAAVNPDLEITEIYDRIVKQGGPALQFSNVTGSEIPLVINLFGSAERMNLLLGVSSADEVARRINEFLDTKPPKSFVEKLTFLPKLKQLDALGTKSVSSGACQEVVLTNGPMLDTLPTQKC